MDSKESFLMYKSWLDITQEMYSDDEEIQKNIIFAIVKYGLTGEKSFPCERMFLMQVFSQIDLAADKWERTKAARAAAGRLGGAPKGNQNASKQAKTSKTETKQAKTSKNNLNVHVHVNENVNDNVHVNENVNVNVPDGTASFGSVSLTDTSSESDLTDEEWEELDGELVRV